MLQLCDMRSTGAQPQSVQSRRQTRVAKVSPVCTCSVARLRKWLIQVAEKMCVVDCDTGAVAFKMAHRCVCVCVFVCALRVCVCMCVAVRGHAHDTSSRVHVGC
jgi:hypothetical protein